MTLETPLFIQPTSGSATYTAAQLRSLIDILVPVDGVTKKNDLKISQRGAGANMTVDMAVGQCAVTGSTIVNQGTYLARATALVNVGTFTVPGSSSKTDLVVAQIYDDQSSDGSGLESWTPRIVAGSVGGGVPATPANSIPLAQVGPIVPSTVSITNAMITDVRALNTLGDVPLWEVSGGNGQSIVSGGSGVAYTGWTVSDNIGMQVLNASGVVAQQSGRYIASFCVRIDQSGSPSGVKQVFIKHTRGGTTIRTATQQTPHIGHDPLSVTSTFRAQPGDLLQAFMFQNSGSTLHIDDALTEAAFSGVWVGP